ncbi:ABC transporter [Bradyrhizobium erythrophlei]|jgi:ABC-type multidrug transport system ATPase subunit|nr:ABC transporter [Bradyrhizobium erythrophlei]
MTGVLGRRPIFLVSPPRNNHQLRITLGAITLDINEGDVLALMGPNASGKSTLLRIILGELAVSSGEVR